MDVLDLDPAVLEATASIIEGYCAKQQSIMDNYLSSTSALSGEWTDDQTLGTLLAEIKRMRDEVTNIMDQIKAAYPKYFRSKAEQIRSRPKF